MRHPTYRNKESRRPEHRRWRAAVLLALLLALAGCNLEDDRDACCEVNRMRYRYLYEEADRFTDFIHRMEYFLFDGQGTYLRQLEAEPGDLTTVSLADLTPGDYSLVAVGNSEGYGSLEGYADDGLQAFRLTVSRMFAGTDAYANGDRLYWGQDDFSIVRGASNSFLTEMANIHCCLSVTVEWELLPPYSDGYRFELSGVGAITASNASEAVTMGVQRFPPVKPYTGRMLEAVRLNELALEADLITLRYTDEDVPRFRLYHEDEPLTDEIDLRRAFGFWNWHPSLATVQEYGILVLIRADGTIEVSQDLKTGVIDWVEGGTFG